MGLKSILSKGFVYSKGLFWGEKWQHTIILPSAVTHRPFYVTSTVYMDSIVFMQNGFLLLEHKENNNSKEKIPYKHVCSIPPR